jgi:hypothetical protein
MYTVCGACLLTWVHDQIYAAGGDHIPEVWASFVDQTGISAIVHLNSDAPAQFVGPLPNAFLWMRIGEEREAGISERLFAAQFIERCLQAGDKILLHSSEGRHRVRWLFVAFLILSGRGVRGTLSLVENRPWLSPYKTDLGIWNEYSEFVKMKDNPTR